MRNHHVLAAAFAAVLLLSASGLVAGHTAVARTAAAPGVAAKRSGCSAIWTGSVAFCDVDLEDQSTKHPDWPLSLLFAGHATMEKVRALMKSFSIDRSYHDGAYMWEKFWWKNGRTVWVDTRGIKTDPCHSPIQDYGMPWDVHMRFYGSTTSGTFKTGNDVKWATSSGRPLTISSPKWGEIVVAAAHIDLNDSCTNSGSPKVWWGNSERAEKYVGSYFKSEGCRVLFDHIPLHNARTDQERLRDPQHYNSNDGKATEIIIPQRIVYRKIVTGAHGQTSTQPFCS